jgi:hypothetical protein
MKDKISLHTVLAMITLLGCLGMAAAQESPIKMTPELHNELTQGGVIQNGVGVSLNAELGLTTVVTPGWNVSHPAYCTTWFDGITTWLYVFSQEGTYVFTANLSAQTTMAPACQTGNRLAFFVVDANIGLWNQVTMYSFK